MMQINFSNKVRKKINIKMILFGITLAVFFLIGCLFMLRPKTSIVEKRELTKFPEFSVESFMNGEYFSQVSTWYSDTYPIREKLISGNKTMQELYGVHNEQLVGGGSQVADEIPDIGGVFKLWVKKINDRIALEKKIEEVASTPAESSPEKKEEKLPDGTITEKGETLGSIYVTKDAGYEMVYFNQKGADNFIATINSIFSRVREKVNFYVMIVPTAAGAMLDDSVIKDMNASDQKKIIDYLHNGINSGVKTVPILDELRRHNAEYIYFRTDHHWTQLGSYYAYICFCREKGIVPKTLEEFKSLEIDGFTGTFCQQAPKLEKHPDTVKAYIPSSTNEMRMIEHVGDQEISWYVINDVSSYDSSNYYATFAGGDTSFAYTHNESITDGSAIMVIKDSFGNAFVPWLVDHYEYVFWVDVRYTNQTISNMAEQFGVKDVLVLFSVFNATTDDKLDRLAVIGQ